MKKFLKAFVRDKLTELNERFDVPLVLRELTLTKLFENAPANQSATNYAVTVSTSLETTIVRAVNLRIDFSFSLAGKNSLDADTIHDRYIYNMLRIFEAVAQWTDEDISQSLCVNDVMNIQITNDDRVEGGLYYQPSIELLLNVTDSTNWFPSEDITTNQAG